MFGEGFQFKQISGMKTYPIQRLAFSRGANGGATELVGPVEMRRHMRRNQISSFARNGRVYLNRPTGASVQSTAGSRGVGISGSNAG